MLAYLRQTTLNAVSGLNIWAVARGAARPDGADRKERRMTPEAWITLCVGLIAIPVAVVQSFQTRRHRVRDYELAFMQRSWTLIDRIPSPRSGESHGTGPQDRDERVAIELYLELCEDEID